MGGVGLEPASCGTECGEAARRTRRPSVDQPPILPGMRLTCSGLAAGQRVVASVADPAGTSVITPRSLLELLVAPKEVRHVRAHGSSGKSPAARHPGSRPLYRPRRSVGSRWIVVGNQEVATSRWVPNASARRAGVSHCADGGSQLGATPKIASATRPGVAE